MSTISFTATTLAQSFSYALLYSLWQGLVIYAMLFILLKSFPAMNARSKYYLSFSALATSFLWFADTWVMQYKRFVGSTVFVRDAGLAGIFRPVSHPATVTSTTAHGVDTIGGMLPGLEKLVPAIPIIYCIGLTFMLLRFLVNILQLQALTSAGVLNPDKKWNDFVENWQYQFGIDRKVRLLLSSKVNVPMMLGVLKPVILLPLATINNLSAEQVESILLHELAHIKRHDYLLNLVQTIIETILFFNPFVWLASSIIRREREHCCDDLVVSSAADPLQYARALALLEDNRVISNSLSLAATGNKNQLFHRIKRIMEMKKNNITQSRVSPLIVAVIVTTFFAVMIVFTPSFAQKVKEEKKATQKKTYKTVTVDQTGKEKVVTKTTKTSRDVKDVDDDVNISISVNDDDKKNATAKIVVISSDDDKKGGGKKRVKREIVIKGDGDDGTAFSGDKVQAELAKAKAEMDEVDWEEVQEEITKAIAEVGKALDIDKLAKEIKIEIHREMEDSKKEMDKAKKEVVESKKIIASASSGGSGHGAHAHAVAGDNVVTSDSDDIEHMLDKMQGEGLIDRSSKFKIEKKNDELYIDGKKQSGDVLAKYRQYLNGKEVTIKGGKGNLNININN